MINTPVQFAKSLVIHAPINTVFSYWSDFGNFEQFINLIENIEVLDSLRSRWRIMAPLGYRIEFESTIVEIEQDRRLVWESHHHYGQARGELDFSANDRHTRVDLVFEYRMNNPRIQRLAQLVSHYGFPSDAFDRGLESIKHKIEIQTVTPE